MARACTVTTKATEADFLLNPTNRTPHKSVTHWLQGRQIDGEIPSHLWRIHDELYDLSKFSDHPGGMQWLELTKGTDVTEAFESFHANPNTTKMLANFVVKKNGGEKKVTLKPRLSPLTFHQDGFYKTLQRKAWDILKTQEKGPSRQSKMISDSLAVSFLVGLLLTAYFSSYFLALCTGLILNFLVGASHNMFHQRDSFRMYYFDLSMFSLSVWRVSHALSHHLFPNSIMDLEISGLDPFFIVLPISPRNAFQRVFSPIYCHIIFCLAMPIEYIREIILVLMGQSKFEVSMLLVLLELLPFVYFHSSITLWCVIHVFASWVFIVTTLVFGAHHHDHAWHQGDEVFAKETGTVDFGIFQLEATVDRVQLVHPAGKAGGGASPQIFRTCSFGDHVLHHLFPTVDASRLPLLYPAFKEVCTQFGIRADVHQLSWFEAGRGFFRQLYRTCVNPSKLQSLKDADSGR